MELAPHVEALVRDLNSIAAVGDDATSQAAARIAAALKASAGLRLLDALLPQGVRTHRGARRQRPAAAGNDPPEGRPPMRRESFSTPEPIRLDLRVRAGQIDIQAGDTTETSVDLEPIGGAESVSAVEE